MKFLKIILADIKSPHAVVKSYINLTKNINKKYVFDLTSTNKTPHTSTNSVTTGIKISTGVILEHVHSSMSVPDKLCHYRIYRL